MSIYFSEFLVPKFQLGNGFDACVQIRKRNFSHFLLEFPLVYMKIFTTLCIIKIFEVQMSFLIRRYYFIFIFAYGLITGASFWNSPQLLASNATARQFKDGDRVCFIGDSITHGGSYHEVIYLYYLTRFPHRKFEIVNCGVSGDSAKGTVSRFDWDIAKHHPTICTIMLGMNDVGRDQYGKEKSDPTWDEKRMKTLDFYKNKMLELDKMIQNLGSELIFISPSIYDQTADLKETNYFGVNDALGQCANFVTEQSKILNRGLVDFHGPMTKLNLEIQAADPKKTLVGNDRVHPGRDGHFVMAYQFLMSQACPSIVSFIELQSGKNKALKQDNCTVSDVAWSNSGVQFTVDPQALPMPMMPGTDVARKLVNFNRDLNQEILKISGLIDGKYQVIINGNVLHTFNSESLAEGCNLADLTSSPQYQQALTVMHLNSKRHQLAQDLRVISLWKHWTLIKDKVNIGDVEAVKKSIDAHLERNKAFAWHGYMDSQAKKFFEVYPKEASLINDMKLLNNELYLLNIPQKLLVEIKKIKT